MWLATQPPAMLLGVGATVGALMGVLGTAITFGVLDVLVAREQDARRAIVSRRRGR